MPKNKFDICLIIDHNPKITIDIARIEDVDEYCKKYEESYVTANWAR